jgi:hypothetical protein
MQARAVAVVKDLFFVARIRETARLVGTPLVFARTPEELTAALTQPAGLVIVDLTARDLDYSEIFQALEGAPLRPPVLGFTTHVLARETQPLHRHCSRIVTKEALTQELPELLKTGVPA